MKNLLIVLGAFVALIAVILILPYLVFGCVLGRTWMEWIDKDGHGNGSCHKVVDDCGNCLYAFSLSDYETDGHLYRLLVWPAGKFITLGLPLEKVAIVRLYDISGKLIAAERIEFQGITGEASWECYSVLSQKFLPKEEDLRLEIEFKFAYCNSDCSKAIVSKVSLTSKRIRYFFSL